MPSLTEFKASLTADQPPAELSAPLRALWFDAKGDWESAHHVAQDIDTPEGAWIHGYLHRKEGDASNAAYWYRRAHKPAASGALDAEWAQIATTLLAGA